MNVKTQLFKTIELISEGELPVLLEVARRFIPADIDDIATPDDMRAHEAAMQDYIKGETVSMR